MKNQFYFEWFTEAHNRKHTINRGDDYRYAEVILAPAYDIILIKEGATCLKRIEDPANLTQTIEERMVDAMHAAEKELMLLGSCFCHSVIELA